MPLAPVGQSARLQALGRIQRPVFPTICSFRTAGRLSSAKFAAQANFSSAAYSPDITVVPGGPHSDSFSTKLRKAWTIFFPQETSRAARDSAKRRLAAVLASDRAGLARDSPTVMQIKAEVSEIFKQHRVQLSKDQDVDLEIRQAQGSAVIYSLHVPVHRVMPPPTIGADCDSGGDDDDYFGVWDEDDLGSDPSHRFPAGC